MRHFHRLALVALPAVLCGAAAETPPHTALLETCCSIGPRDLEALNQGQALGRLIHMGDDSDIAILGAIRLEISKEKYLEWYRNVGNYTYSSLVKQAVQFHTPPRPEDVRTLAIDPNQIKLWRDCRPGKCGLKLSDEEISRARTEVDWNAPDALQQASELARRLLLRYVTRYFERGDRALATYHDQPQAEAIRSTFQALLDSSPYVRNAFPELFARLARFHGAGEADAGRDGDIVYWSREQYGFGLKPLISVMHSTMYQVSPSVVVIGAKQIWASHYYDGSLGITVLVDANPGTYLIYLNRSRIDLLRTAGFKRWLVRKFAPGSIRKEVTGLKRRLESAPAAAEPEVKEPRP